MDKKIFQIDDFKTTKDNESFYVSGYANNKGIADSYGDVPSGSSVYDFHRYKKNPILLINHNSETSSIIGSMVDLKEDKKGFRFKARLMDNPQTDEAKHAIQAIKEGHLRTLSIGGKWTYSEEKGKEHILIKASLYETSFVPIPADANALADLPQVKKLEKDLKKLQEEEREKQKKRELKMEEQKQDFSKEIKTATENLTDSFSEKLEKNSKDLKVDILEKIEEKMKKVQIHLNKFKSEPLKAFNHRTGKNEVVGVENEARQALKKMFVSILDGQKESAKSISKEIEQDNLNFKATLRSDVSTSGGFTIPAEVQNEILMLEYEKSVMMDAVSIQNITANSKLYNIASGLDVGYIANQDTALAEKTMAFRQEEISMQRIGGFIPLSNTIIRQKGADITSLVVDAFSSKFASFLDLHIAVGSVTGDSDLVDGIAFDKNTKLNTTLALSALTLEKLKEFKNQIESNSQTGNLRFICNTTVLDKIALLKETNGAFLFPTYIQNGAPIKPFGVKFIENNSIPSTLLPLGDKRTTGNKNVLLLVDKTKVIAGISPISIDSSSHFKFTHDQLVIRGVRNFGMAVVLKTADSFSTTQSFAISQELS